MEEIPAPLTDRELEILHALINTLIDVKATPREGAEVLTRLAATTITLGCKLNLRHQVLIALTDQMRMLMDAIVPPSLEPSE